MKFVPPFYCPSAVNSRSLNPSFSLNLIKGLLVNWFWYLEHISCWNKTEYSHYTWFVIEGFCLPSDCWHLTVISANTKRMQG